MKDAAFQELLTSVRQAGQVRRGTRRPSRTTTFHPTDVQAVRAKLFQCFLDASASEHAARMTAMKYASENADDLIHELTVRYNRARQSQITMELAEIMGGRAGVEGM